MNSFTRTLKLMIAANVLIGVLFLVWPGVLADGGHTDGSDAGVRGLGLALILLSFAVAPAALFPLANPYLALFAAVAQVVLGLFFLFATPDLWWLLGLYAFVIAYLLAATFWQGFRADLMARP